MGFLRSIRLMPAMALLMAFGPALSQEAWQVRPFEGSVPAGIVTETRQPNADGMPDGFIAVHAGRGDIRSAWYSLPTTRYRHDVLGDAVEAGMLKVETPRGRVFSLRLPSTEVFEDLAPRLADLDGDGTIEVVTIRSSLTQGASVTIYGLSGNTLIEKASTGFIGTANRWLNIAAIAPFTGGRTPEIAFVRTPHIGGTLFFYKFAGGRLLQIGAMRGFSNHVIGSRELRLSAVADANGDGRPDLALPSNDRRALRIVGFTASGLSEIGRAPLPGPVDKAIGIAGTGSAPGFIAGIKDGSVLEIRRQR